MRRHWEFAESATEVFFQVHWVEAGWPVSALRGGSGTWRKGNTEYGTSFQTAVALPSEWAKWDYFFGALLLPAVPTPVGFALDTAFYAAIAFTLWCAPGVVRRRRRRARGLCPACGYDLKGAPTATCPECGS
jgi:hypothetical protein